MTSEIAWTKLDQGLRDVLVEPQPGDGGAIAPGRPGVPVSPLMSAMPRPAPVRVAVVGLGKLGVAHTAVLSMVPNRTRRRVRTSRRRSAKTSAAWATSRRSIRR